MPTPRPRRGSRRFTQAKVYRGGPVPAKRTPPPVRRSRDTIDWDAVADVLAHPPPVERVENRLPVTGRCYDCAQRVSGERRYCGPCLVKRGTI